MVTFFVFHAVSSLAFLGLLAAWTACGYVLVKASGTPTMGVIIHIGAPIGATSHGRRTSPQLTSPSSWATRLFDRRHLRRRCRRMQAPVEARAACVAGMTLIAGLANQAEPLLECHDDLDARASHPACGCVCPRPCRTGTASRGGTNPSMAHGLDIAAEIVWGLVAPSVSAAPDLVPASISPAARGGDAGGTNVGGAQEARLGHELRSVSLAAMFSTFVACRRVTAIRPLSSGCSSSGANARGRLCCICPRGRGIASMTSPLPSSFAIHVLFVAAGWCDKAFVCGMVPALLQRR